MTLNTIRFGAVCILLFACVPASREVTAPQTESALPPPLTLSPKQPIAWMPGPDLVPCDELDWRGPLGRSQSVFADISAESVEFSSEDRLSNASPATRESAAGIVRVLVGDGKCTGTLIDQQWVLTAAHCAFDFSEDKKRIEGASADARVHFGREMKSGGRTVPGTIYCHRNYGLIGRYHVNDLALVRLEEPETVEDSVRIVAKGSAPMANQPSAFFFVFGFGKTSYKRTWAGTSAEPVDAKELMTGPMQVDQTPNACASTWPSKDTTFCADTSSDRGPAALCGGDSGGPAFVAAQDVGRRQVGVSSFTRPPPTEELNELLKSQETPDWLKASLKEGAVCGVEGNRSGFVDLARYRDWLEESTGVSLP